MTAKLFSRRPDRLVFILFVLLCLAFSGTAFGKKRNTSGRSARAQKSSKKSSARNRTSRGRVTARVSRRGGSRSSARDVRRQRAVVAREQSSAVRALERK